MQTVRPDGKGKLYVHACGCAWMCMWPPLDYAATSIDDGHHKGAGQQLRLVLCLLWPTFAASTTLKSKTENDIEIIGSARLGDPKMGIHLDTFNMPLP